MVYIHVFENGHILGHSAAFHTVVSTLYYGFTKV